MLETRHPRKIFNENEVRKMKLKKEENKRIIEFNEKEFHTFVMLISYSKLPRDIDLVQEQHEALEEFNDKLWMKIMKLNG